MTAFTDVLDEARDVIGVRRVYGEPFQKNGVTVIPAARVMGGAGAGTGVVPRRRARRRRRRPVRAPASG